MGPRERSDSGTFVETVSLEDVIGVFDDVRGPVITSSDVADQLDCTTEAARQKLQRLYDRGEVDKRKTGRVVVWWHTGGTPPTPAERTTADTDAVDAEVRGSVDTSLADDDLPAEDDDTAGESIDLPTEYDPEVRRAVDDVAEGWADDDRLENRKRAALAVLQYALETGDGVGKSHPVIDAVRATYPVEGQSRDTFWRRNLRDGILKTYGEYSKGTHSYTVESLPTNDDAEDSGVYDPTEEF